MAIITQGHDLDIHGVSLLLKFMAHMISYVWIFLLLVQSHSLVNFLFDSDKAYFVDLFVRASNTPAIKMYEKVMYCYFL